MILNIFKSKPTLKELISKGFIDIHSHILPGIDDGAKDVNESLNLISNMKDLGFNKIIATPHIYQGIYNNNLLTIKKSFNKLIKNYEGDLKFKYASEYMVDYSLIQKIEEKSLLTINKNNVLIEFSYMPSQINFHEIIFKLSLNGYIPVLAHPERYSYLFDNINNYFKLKDIGCKFQINLLSLTGLYGLNVLKICKKLLDNNLFDYAGSDIHSLRHIKYFEKKIKLNKSKEVIKIIENNYEFNW